VSAVVAGLLLNLRSVAFGVVMAPALTGPWWQRALWSQLMIDESTAIGSAQSERRWRRYGYLCGGLAVFVSWNVSTLVGAVGLSSTGDLISDWGIDATIPAAFLALLWPRLRDEAQRRSALAGAAIALALIPVAPPGVPIVAGGLGVALGWRRAGGRAAAAPAGLPPDADVPAGGQGTRDGAPSGQAEGQSAVPGEATGAGRPPWARTGRPTA
jgi:predicted branched-subunit amino acid permease